jgi:hypothetical protein
VGPRPGPAPACHYCFAQSAPPVAKAATPGKPQATALLKTKLAKRPFRVSDVLDDVGGGRFPVLYTTSARHCEPLPGMSEEEVRAERKACNSPDICASQSLNFNLIRYLADISTS